MTKNNSGSHNSGDFNSGSHNSGDFNSGSHNSGDFNSGNRNSGDFNSGDFNSGNSNSGYFNSGNSNSGYFNSGNSNSGYFNSGNRNSGDFNSGNSNSGYFNTITPTTIICFNKELEREVWEKARKPSWLDKVKPFTFVTSSAMSEKEKKDNPSWEYYGGYFKRVSLKESWAECFKESTKEDIDLIKNLPNFDPEVFFEITGIDLKEQKKSCEGKVVEVEGKKYKLVEI